MKLLLTVWLTCSLLYTAESLRCHMCTNDDCTNSTSVTCPDASNACRTISSVMASDSSTRVTVHKNCSSLSTCVTPLFLPTEWSVNRGFRKEAHNQLCCVTDNCNFRTLATPNTLTNGKECPSCVSTADNICNTTLFCQGIEDSCFSGTTTSNSTEVFQFGCISRNLCATPLAIQAVLGANAKVTCGAPWSARISAVLLTAALTAHRLLVS